MILFFMIYKKTGNHNHYACQPMKKCSSFPKIYQCLMSFEFLVSQIYDFFSSLQKKQYYILTNLSFFHFPTYVTITEIGKKHTLNDN